MPRGRIKGRIYADMLCRGLVKTAERLQVVVTATKKFNTQAKKYEHGVVAKKTAAKLDSALRQLAEVQKVIEELG